MRNLTILREKTFVASLAKIKIYVEDTSAGDTLINGVKCRKLGEIKNGEEKTFEIENSATKVFVIADQLSKNYCNEFFELPEGNEDIRLTGKNTFNPFAGNPFRFNGNNSPEVERARKKGGVVGVVVTILAAVVGFALGYILVNVMLK